MAAPARMDPDERTASAPDGTRLAISRWSPTGDPRAQLVVVHGLKDHGTRYAALARALLPEGFEVVAADLRGHGASGGRPQYVDRFDAYASDVDSVLRAVPVADATPRFLFGHSMGGAIVTRWLLERNPAVAGVVLSGPALRSPPTVSAGARAVVRFLGRVAPGAGVFRPPFEDFSRDPETVEEMGRDPLVNPRPVPARTMAQLLRSMDWCRARYALARVPLLVLHGTEDRLTDPSESEAFVRAAASTDKTLRIYPGLYHDLLHEPERGVVLGDIVRWLLDRTPAPERAPR